ncbi:hypothetical protein KM546_gp10 [Porcine lymphotropic herpesvirus 3]|uniref:Uncharacterized protein n=1 Tax=Suid gammaherpesvirus 5 TaxID=1960251 RepID=Q8B405_9GAMA|nr:hypothetical protein KM546_gp10 [Porcine lymphotropic herpesvirus 3]AAO12317.1 unknown [Porcine lymphotropic herpesvirus 3]
MDTAVTIDLGLWTLRASFGRFILVNNYDMDFKLKITHFNLPFSVKHLADELVSFGLVKSLFDVSTVRASCAVILQCGHCELYRVLPSCILDYTTDISVFIKTNTATLRAGELSLVLLFITPIPSSKVSCTIVATKSERDLKITTLDGVPNYFNIGTHISGRIQRSRENIYELVIRGEFPKDFINVNEIFCMDDNAEIVEIKTLLIERIDHESVKISITTFNSEKDSLEIRAKFSFENKPEVVFLHYLGWISCGYDSKAVPIYLDQQKTMRPFESIKVKLKTMYGIYDSSARGTKIAVCGLSDTSFWIAESKIWQPMSIIVLTIHNISDRSITLYNNQPVAIALIIRCKTVEGRQGDGTYFDAINNSLYWQDSELLEDCCTFHWHHHIAVRESCQEESMIY